MFNIKGWSVKKVNLDWHWVGLLPLTFGILSYIIAIARFADPWKLQWMSWGLLLWACPLTAVATGVVLLFLPRNRFAISALAAWIFNGPLLPALFDTRQMLQLQQFHHFVSAAVLLVILYHWKEIWNTKGFLFGVASFYAFVIITFNLSGGVVNLLEPFKKIEPPMWMGVISAILSVVIFLWYKLGFERARKLKS